MCYIPSLTVKFGNKQFKAEGYSKLGLQAEKNRAYHEYEKNIAMTDCLVILYPV